MKPTLRIFSAWTHKLAACTLLVSGLSAHAWQQDEIQIPQFVTAENLENFELSAPELSADEIFDTEQAVRAEASGEFDRLWESLRRSLTVPGFNTLNSFAPQAGRSPNIVIEIFQNAKSVGKQFLVAREFGRIRYVFVVSGGGNGKSTPGGTFGVNWQTWRHMSSLYHSRGENNMDHATFFLGGIAFHSTTFGNYAKLGRADSHGCVRMGRPQARKIFTLIRNNGSKATIISRKTGEPQASDLDVIRKQLSKDVNFVQWMLSNKERGDVPFNEKEYRDYLAGLMSENVVREKMRRMGLSRIVELPRDQDLGPFSSPGEAVLQ